MRSEGPTLTTRADSPEPGWVGYYLRCEHDWTTYQNVAAKQLENAGFKLWLVGALAVYHVQHCPHCPDVRTLIDRLGAPEPHR
jgi:hypothetical protein